MPNVTIEYFLYIPRYRQNRSASLYLIRNNDDPSKNTDFYPGNFDVRVITDEYLVDTEGVMRGLDDTISDSLFKFFFMSVIGAENGNFVLTINPENPTIRTGTGDMNIKVLYIAAPTINGLNNSNFFDAWNIDTCNFVNDAFVEKIEGDYTDASYLDIANTEGIVPTSELTEHITAKNPISNPDRVFVEWVQSAPWIDVDNNGNVTTNSHILLIDGGLDDILYFFAFYRNTPPQHGGPGGGTNTCRDLYNAILAAIPGRDSAIGPDRVAKQQHINNLVDRFHSSCPGLRLPPGTNYTGSGDGGGLLGGGSGLPHV